MINSTASQCWFTAALVSLIYARRVSQVFRPPPSLNLPSFQDGFEVAFEGWCRFSDAYILRSSAVVNMFINSFVNQAGPVQEARRNEFRTRYMAPEDLFEDFGQSPQAQFYSNIVHWIESRDACNCRPAANDVPQDASPSNLVLLEFPDRNQTVADKFAQLMDRYQTIDNCPACKRDFLQCSKITFLDVGDVLILAVNRRPIVRGRPQKINDPLEVGGDLTIQLIAQQLAVTFRVRY